MIRLKRAYAVTFVYAARDEEHDSAAVLKEVVEGRREGEDERRSRGR